MGRSKGKTKSTKPPSPKEGKTKEGTKDHKKHNGNAMKDIHPSKMSVVQSNSDSATRRGAKKGKSESNGVASSSLQHKLMEKKERERIVLWRKPLVTIHYFLMELLILSREYLLSLWNYKKTVLLLVTSLVGLYFASITQGPHQHILRMVNKDLWWCLWWVWLGILSSVGLGTGLHTFLLYLGPHIASVTMAAYLCDSLDFQEPPYPDEIICPENGEASKSIVSIWTIMSKVRLEAFMWGAGTALGELPPYFMARGARLSGVDPDDEELEEFEELQKIKDHPEEMSWLDAAKLSIEKLVEKVGFFGILACASIPNPLFDLAGITCGHFLVPFWTFFGATLIGKAVVKMHIQKLFVIIAFNEPLLEQALEIVSRAPVVGPLLHKPFMDFLQSQKKKLKRKASGSASQAQKSGNILSWLFEKIIVAMILYFVLSIINSLAQSYHKRICRKKNQVQKKALD